MLTAEQSSLPLMCFKIALAYGCFCSATTNLHETASSLEHGTLGDVHVSAGVPRDQRCQILELEFQVGMNSLITGVGSSVTADFSTTEPFLQSLHLVFLGRISLALKSSARMAGHRAPRFPCLCIPSTWISGTSLAFTWC